MGKIIGIDIGTSLCRTAIYKSGSVEIVPNRFSEGKMRLQIEYFRKDNQLQEISKGTIPAFSFSSIKQKIGFEETMQIEDRDTTAIELTTNIFRAIKEDIKGHTNEEICGAVVAVPPCFTEKQRSALKMTVEKGGFDMVKLLDSSTATVMAAEIQEEGKVLLVYALGAGVFTVSVFRIDHGMPQALCHEGDRHLGGNEFDAAIISYILNKLELGPSILNYGISTIKKLKDLAEQIKIRLSKKTEVEFDVNIIDLFSNDSLGYTRDKTKEKIILTRSEFENTINQYVEKTISLTKKAIQGAGCTNEDINSIILIGGSCKVPLVESRIREEFGKDIILEPDELVVKGAALYASQVPIEEKKQIDSHEKEESTPLKVDIEIPQRGEVRQTSAESWHNEYSPRLINAQSLWGHGNQDKAIETVEGLIEDLSGFLAHLYCSRGELLLKNNDFDRAVSYFEKGLFYSKESKSIRETCHKAYKRIGLNLFERGYLHDAKIVIKKGLKCVPECSSCKGFLKQIEDAIKKKKFPGSGRYRWFR